MKRLLSLVLGMGMVGIGGGAEGPPADDDVPTATPKNPPAQVAVIDPVAELENLRAKITRNDNGEVVGLRLRGWHVTDAGLMHLMGLTNLQSLCLAGSAKEFAQALESGGLGRRCASACDISRK